MKNRKRIQNPETELPAMTGDSKEAADEMQKNYCSLINKDFDAAMKVIFEETPEPLKNNKNKSRK